MSSRRLAFSLAVDGANKITSSLATVETELLSIAKAIALTTKDLATFNSGSATQIKRLTDAGKSVNKLEQEYKDLRAVQADLRVQRKTLNTELKTLATAFDVVNRSVGENSVAALRQEYQLLQQQLQETNKAALITPGALAKIARAKDLKKQIAGINNQINGVSKNAARFNKILGRTGTQILAAFGVSSIINTVVQAVKSAANIIIEFEDSVNKLGAISGATGETLATLEAQALDLGATTAFTATEVAKLQTELARLGFVPAEIEAATESLIDLSIALDSDAARAAKLAGAQVRAFNLEAIDMQRVASVLGIVTTKSALDIEKLENSLKQVSPVARGFGFSIEETTALLAQLVDAGFKGEQAGTALRNILLNLADANGDLALALGENVTSFDQLIPALNQLKDDGIKLSDTLAITDKRSVTAFNTFLQGADKTKILADELKNLDGELEELANKRLETIKGRVLLFNSALEGLITSFEKGTGEAAGFFKGSIDAATDLLTILRLINENRINPFTGDGGGIIGAIDSFREIKQTEAVIALQEKRLKSTIKTQEDFANISERTINQFIAKYEEAGLTYDQASAKVANYLAILQQQVDSENKVKAAVEAGTKSVRERLEELRRSAKILEKALLNQDQSTEAFTNLKAQLEKVNSEIDDLTLTREDQKEKDKEASDSIVENLLKEIETYEEAMKRADVATLDPEDRLAVYTELLERRRQLDIADATRRIKDEKLLALELQRINNEANTAIANEQVLALDPNSSAALKLINEIAEKAEELEDIELNIKLAQQQKVIDDAQQLGEILLTNAIENEDRLQNAIGVLKQQAIIQALEFEVGLVGTNAQRRFEIEKELIAAVAKERELQAKLDVNFDERSKNIDDGEDLRTLSSTPIFDPDRPEKSLEDIEEFERKQTEIKLEAELQRLELERQLTAAQGEDTLALEAEIGVKRLELAQAINADLIKTTEERLKKEAKLEAEYGKIAGDLLEESGNLIGEYLDGSIESFEEVNEEFIKLTLSTIEKIILLQIAAAVAREIGTKGAIGVATGAVLAGLIKGVFAVAKGAVSSEQGNVLGSTDKDRGHIVVGPSHANGGVKFRVKGDPRQHEYEGGEAVINKKATKKHRDLLSAINESTGGKSFSRNSGKYKKALKLRDGGQLGTIRGIGTNIPQVAGTQVIITSAKFSDEQVDKLSANLSESIGASVLKGAKDGSMQGLSVGSQEANRLAEREQLLENETG